jgi:formate-dependent nitrite reductase membrane component NrfD
LWQSPVFIWHLLVQALIGGAALLIIAAVVFSAGPATILATTRVLLAALTVGLAMILIELTLPAMSEDFRRAADLISRGELSFRFWIGVVLIGTIVPLILLGTTLRTGGAAPAASAAMLALVGLWTFENLWIEAGQAVPLS